MGWNEKLFHLKTDITQWIRYPEKALHASLYVTHTQAMPFDSFCVIYTLNMTSYG